MGVCYSVCERCSGLCQADAPSTGPQACGLPFLSERRSVWTLHRRRTSTTWQMGAECWTGPAALRSVWPPYHRLMSTAWQMGAECWAGPAALSDSIADQLANAPLAGLQAPAEAHAPLGEQVHPVAARQQLRSGLHGRLLQAQAPLYRQRLAIQEELAACRPALRHPHGATSLSLRCSFRMQSETMQQSCGLLFPSTHVACMAGKSSQKVGSTSSTELQNAMPHAGYMRNPQSEQGQTRAVVRASCSKASASVHGKPEVLSIRHVQTLALLCSLSKAHTQEYNEWQT